MRVQITYELAMAAGKDAANRSMREAGRTTWTEADYAECCRVFAQLLPEPRADEIDAYVERA